MGSFFANVQVHTPGRPAEDARAEVVEAVRHSILEGPFVEADDGEGGADRTVLVAPAGDEP